MGGTPRRMEQFAYYIANQIGYELPAGTILNDISKNSHRYAMYKVGPVLSVSVSRYNFIFRIFVRSMDVALRIHNTSCKSARS